MVARILIEVLMVYFVFSQIATPALRGEPLFPIFRRRREAQLLDEIDHARQDLTEDELEENLRQLRSKHESKQPPQSPVA